MNYIDFIKLYHSYINNFKIEFVSKNEITDLDKKNIYENFVSSPFISNELKEKLLKKFQSKIYDYIFPLNTSNGLINFHFISDKSSKAINNLKKYYFFIIYIVLSIGKNNFLPNVFINIITVNVHKKISRPITINDINSASTKIHHPLFGGPIYIWRNDEIEKVLIHETLHSVLYDYDIISQELNPELKKLEQTIDINGRGLNINEAYTELCATFIMTLFNKKKSSILKQLNEMLKHSLENCAKLFEKYDVNDPRKCTLINELDKCLYYQEASAFSYIVIKTGFLWAILKNCKLNGKQLNKIKCMEEFLSIGFTGRIGEKYQEMIVGILRNDEFNKSIEKYMGKTERGRPKNFYFTIFH